MPYKSLHLTLQSSLGTEQVLITQAGNQSDLERDRARRPCPGETGDAFPGICRSTARLWKCSRGAPIQLGAKTSEACETGQQRFRPAFHHLSSSHLQCLLGSDPMLGRGQMFQIIYYSQAVRPYMMDLFALNLREGFAPQSFALSAVELAHIIEPDPSGMKPLVHDPNMKGR